MWGGWAVCGVLETESSYCLVLTFYVADVSIAVPIFTQMMINIIRFHTSIGSIERQSFNRLRVLSLKPIDKIHHPNLAQSLVKYR